MRIMGKAMAKAVGVDAEIVCGADQLCTGLKGGVEGAIHAVSGEFDSGGVECAILEMKRPAEEGPQAWFADDSAKRRGPLRGYHPNGKKSKLVVRAGCKERAREVFGDTDVEIVSGARYMEGFVGTAEGKRAYATERVQEWQRCVNRMADAAAKYPQAAHTALTTSLQAEWDFFMRVMPEERATFEPLRDALTHYLTQLSSHVVTATEVQLMMLPARHGGMGVRDPTERVAAAYETSTKGTSLLVSII
ncbi:unnamed protein product [Vitrella brassicaformis CCMP3155]|uniref:Uncharacterized protein n=1 Tax=Vitrella brassicaformis (strain CCMP3155) TaxID=1169540 RepID=A0A0G4GUP0_VITBC|nr:unnamed protein product [Vitrella brassicaformis CCMP3155]|eukprot:CEM34533.1 unnamed protein product [Vitrella brassicaformis CCMP3155]